MTDAGTTKRGSLAAEPARGRSLWSDAWRRLLKNRMAVFGLIVVAIMGFISTFAALIVPFDPQNQERWIGARAPGYEHDEIVNEIRIAVGQEADPLRLTPSVTDFDAGEERELRFEVVPRTVEQLRVLVSRGRVSQIKAGSEILDAVDLADPLDRLRPLTEAGDALDPLPTGSVLRTGEPPPPEMVAAAEKLDIDVSRRWVMLLQLDRRARPDNDEVVVRLDGRTVTAITVNGEAREALVALGRDVADGTTTLDGEPLRHTHPLGTDLVGRDVLSRAIMGGRISLLIGLVATLVSVTIGVIYGAISGYYSDRAVSAGFILGLVPFVGVLILGAVPFSYDPAQEAFADGASKFILVPGGAYALGYGIYLAGCITSVAVLWVLGPFGLLGGGVKRLLARPLTTVDGFMMRIVDILYTLPYMFLVILLMVNFGRNILMLFAALGVVQWLTMARIVRGQALSLKRKEFVDAALVSGSSDLKIVFIHIIPNVLGVVAVYATLTIPIVILQESFLSFIGLTVQWDGQALESWGALVNYGRESLERDGGRSWLLLVPSAAMAITLFAMNFLGDGLRDALDPRMKGRG